MKLLEGGSKAPTRFRAASLILVTFNERKHNPLVGRVKSSRRKEWNHHTAERKLWSFGSFPEDPFLSNMYGLRLNICVRDIYSPDLPSQFNLPFILAEIIRKMVDVVMTDSMDRLYPERQGSCKKSSIVTRLK